MKKTILYSVLAAHCLFLSAKGQADPNPSSIGIGQHIPDIPLTYYYQDKPVNGKLSDFRGKLLIIDFWATWCSPCVAMLPKMEQLQSQFADKIQFLPVTYQQATVVLPFLQNTKLHQHLSSSPK